jgi:DNA replication factor GINS
MDLSYDEIRRIHRLEKNTSKLVEVEQDFFGSLNEFIKLEKEDYISSLKDFSVSKARNFTNLKKMVEEIFSLREKKILSLALVSARTNELNEEHMALQEKSLYNEMIKVLNKHKSLMNQVFEGPSELPKAKALNNVSIRVLSDIPSFIGTDMKEYGPFKKDEEVELPFKIAKLFVSRKLGENVG